MIIQSEMEARIVDAGSEAMADYNRAVVLYENQKLTKDEFLRIGSTITLFLVDEVERIKAGDNNE